MKLQLLSTVSAGFLLVGLVTAQETAKIKRTADGHPDLSGLWAYAVDLPSGGIKRQADGKVIVKHADLSNRRAPKGEVKGALPFTSAPAYKPEFQAKVKDLIDHESRTDPVFYCGRPGVPRIGPPERGSRSRIASGPTPVGTEVVVSRFSPQAATARQRRRSRVARTSGS